MTTTSTRFDRAILLILRHEGGYVNDPKDPGGETNFGISKRSYLEIDIKSLTKQSASEIYYRDYWQPNYCDDLPWPLAIQVFDYAVNAGSNQAARALQKLVGASVDGWIGPKTVSKAQNYKLHDSGHKHAASRFAEERIRYYASLRQFPRYGKAWVRRTIETLIEAIT